MLLKEENGNHMKRNRILAGSAALVVGAARARRLQRRRLGRQQRRQRSTMTLWQNSTTGPGQQFWKDAIAAFEKDNPNVTIKIQSVQNEDMDGKLQTALNAGDAPDIFLQRGGGKMAAMVEAGQLMDLTGTITDDAKDEHLGEGSFKAETYRRQGLRRCRCRVLPGGIFYSKDLFDAGRYHRDARRRSTSSRPPIDKLKAAGIAPIALGAKDAWPAAHWYYFFALRECCAGHAGRRPAELEGLRATRAG